MKANGNDGMTAWDGDAEQEGELKHSQFPQKGKPHAQVIRRTRGENQPNSFLSGEQQLFSGKDKTWY